jgi:hypothetical protein
MNELAARYAPMLKHMAELHADDPDVVAQLEAAEVIEETWDENRAGGHLKLTVPPSAPAIDCDTIEVLADDADGGMISIILQIFDDRLNWGEWYRCGDSEPVKQWPPSSVSRA